MHIKNRALSGVYFIPKTLAQSYTSFKTTFLYTSNTITPLKQEILIKIYQFHYIQHIAHFYITLFSENKHFILQFHTLYICSDIQESLIKRVYPNNFYLLSNDKKYPGIYLVSQPQGQFVYIGLRAYFFVPRTYELTFMAVTSAKSEQVTGLN